MTYDTVIFDMDGTLLDTLEDLRRSTNYALAKHGFAERSLSEVRGFVGNGVRKLVERALPDHAKERAFDAVFKDFCTHYAIHCSDMTKPYPQVPELIAELSQRGYKLGIVSNKSDAEVKKLNEKFFHEQIAVAVGNRPGISRKPAPDSFSYVLETLGSSVEKTLYVGDSGVDVAMARNANVDLVSVTWGFRQREQLEEAGAVRFIDTPLELLTYLNS